jgi:pimeloyl-ACP methyl ester carboxylesterase
LAHITVAHPGLRRIKLNALDTGGPGRAVVLIHGWLLALESWNEQIPALTSAGHRVVAYDRRGFGLSDKPKDGYTYEMLAEDLHVVICELALQATLVGFGMGGGEIVHYLTRHGVADREGGTSPRGRVSLQPR